jgi:hypothetical protein
MQFFMSRAIRGVVGGIFVHIFPVAQTLRSVS